jgi:PAS domain S-box-containing protein
MVAPSRIGLPKGPRERARTRGDTLIKENTEPRTTFKSAVLLAGSFLLVGLVVAASLWAFRRMENAGAARQHTHDVLGHANDLLSALRDGETGIRGYAITGDERFLEPYLAVRDTIGPTMEGLRRLTKGGVGREHLDSLAPLVDAKLEHMARVVELGRGKDSAAAAAEVRTGEGKRIMDSIRAELGSFIKLEEDVLLENEATLQSNMGTLFALISLASLFALLLVLVFAYSIYRDAQNRHRATASEGHRQLLNLQEETNQRLQGANDILRDSQEKLSVTLNSIGDAVIATDADARVTRLNRVGEQLTGWTQAEALGLPVGEIFRIVNKETRQPAAIPVVAALAMGVVQGLANHTSLIARGGSECDIADSCAPIRDRDGKVVGAVLVFRDVTEEYKVQQALRDSAALIHTILNTLADGLMTIHARGGVIETVNPAAERMFGYSAAELIGKPFSLVIPELDRDKHSGSLEYYAASDEARAVGLGREVLGQRKDGSSFPLEIVLSEMTLGGKRYFTGILRDVTTRHEVAAEQRKLDQKLRDQQYYTRSLIESNVDALMTTDHLGIISDVNKQMETLTGCTRDELIGAPFKRCFTDPDRAEDGIRQVLIDKKIMDYELTARSRDGRETVVSYNATTFYDRDRRLQGVFAAARDITERKRMDLILQQKSVDLESATSAAEKASRAKSDFLSSMSHELRTPLGAILGFAQLMESETPPPTPAQKRSVDEILKAGWYLLELINEILDLALIESGKLSLSMEPNSLAEVMNECRALTEPQAALRGIRMTFPPVETSYFVNADRTRLKQILVNLLSNAIKYNKAGGTVAVNYLPGAEGRVRIGIEDTGEGLTPGKMAQLFQPFNRLGKELGAVEGTGIGLVVCKRLIDAMAGVMGVESTPGQGSLFWIELSLTAEPTFVARLGPSPALEAQGRVDSSKRTLLYVEDNPANLTLVEKLIERRPDLRLLSARDGHEGIEVARAHRPDVILMDINLPGITGIQALRILAHDPTTAHIPVVAISANAMPRDVENGMEAGFFRYLTKPMRVPEFMDTLDAALALRENAVVPSP